MTTPDLAQALRDGRDEIVSRFIAEVKRKDLSPPGVSRSLLTDHIPKFLDEIISELVRLDSVRVTLDAIDTSEPARKHGEQRWNLGYDLEALIREYGVIRHCILETAKNMGVHVSINEFDVLAKCLSVGVAVAATEYVKFRDAEVDAQKANVEFLANAGQLLSSSLDYGSTLSRLTGLLVPRMADWCAVHVHGRSPEEMPLAHVDAAKVPLLRNLYERYPPPVDSAHGYPHVVRTGEPQFVPSVDPRTGFETAARSPDHLEMLRALGTCSWITVPLRVQGNVFGALTLAYSESGRHHTPQDLVLAGELARRAAVAIDNARLYELSQRERSRVEAATRAKDEFVAMVSHELRTPLNAILGWLRLMRSGSLDARKREHALEVIERNAEAQNQLIADLLDISRIITGKIRINPAQVDFADIIDMAVEGVRPAAEGKRIRIEVKADRNDATFRGDGDRLQQVVWNLLVNAVKFTPKGGLIQVTLGRVDSDLELTVEDDGEGIAPNFIADVFESFRQHEGGASRSHGGLGIGLSIAKHIVDLHGGTIEARSAGKGQGATFVVRLPVSPVVSTTLGVSRVPATKLPVFETELPTGLSGLRVLVVDDERDAGDLIANVLEACGMEVHFVGSVASAMAELGDFVPDVVISDIGMPEEDGYSLIRAIRTLPNEQKNVPVIALTAFARNEDRTRALVEGFNQFIAKPVEPAALARAVVELAGSPWARERS